MSDIETLHSNYQLIEKAIKYIDAHFKEQPSIDVIASNIGMSKYHFIRVFKEYVGVTPMQFLHSVTLNYAKEHIKESKSILDSSLDIGLSSVSRLHELFVNLIGVTPKEWREKGKDVVITYGFGITPFGQALIAYTDKVSVIWVLSTTIKRQFLRDLKSCGKMQIWCTMMQKRKPTWKIFLSTIKNTTF